MGTVLEMGTRALEAERVAEIIASKDRQQAGPCCRRRGCICSGYGFEPSYSAHIFFNNHGNKLEEGDYLVDYNMKNCG